MNGNPCSQSSGYLLCTCNTPTCTDFPTIHINILTNTESGETFNISLESNYTMRRHEDYMYRLMIQTGPANDLGGNTIQWIFG